MWVSLFVIRTDSRLLVCDQPQCRWDGPSFYKYQAHFEFRQQTPSQSTHTHIHNSTTAVVVHVVGLSRSRTSKQLYLPLNPYQKRHRKTSRTEIPRKSFSDSATSFSGFKFRRALAVRQQQQSARRDVASEGLTREEVRVEHHSFIWRSLALLHRRGLASKAWQCSSVAAQGQPRDWE